MSKPSLIAYKELQQAYDFFNEYLFNNELPNLLITFQRGKYTFGYFAPDRFTGKSTVSELALNPDYFGERSLADTLSTLAHEMCHVWQHYAPVKKCRTGYHDKVWAQKMISIGLMPSSTGLQGGRKTGQQMTHYIMKGELFQQVVYNLLASGFEISWYDKYSENIVTPISKVNHDILIDWINITASHNIELINKLTKTVNSHDLIMTPSDATINIKPIIKNTGNRDKFTCPNCGLNAWAKPMANLICGDCNKKMTKIF